MYTLDFHTVVAALRNSDRLQIPGVLWRGSWVYRVLLICLRLEVGRALRHFIFSLIGLKRILFTNIFQRP